MDKIKRENISPHFQNVEFATTSRGAKYVEMNLAFINKPENKEKITKLCTDVLEPIRAVLVSDEFDLPYMTITSGVRCPELNKLIGGSTSSQHVWCEAADFVVDGDLKNTRKMFQMIMDDKVPNLKYESIGQVILERRARPNGTWSSWIHISIKTDRFIGMRKHAKRNYTYFPEYMISLDGSSYTVVNKENLEKYVKE